MSCFDAGDVEHTHLVKGLDYALLNKVRSEIDKKPDSGGDAEGKARYLIATATTHLSRLFIFSNAVKELDNTCLRISVLFVFTSLFHLILA